MAKSKFETDRQQVPAEKAAVPKRICLTAPHSYYTESNELRAWHPGQIVEGDEAAHLIERKALHEELL